MEWVQVSIWVMRAASPPGGFEDMRKRVVWEKGGGRLKVAQGHQESWNS